MPLAKFRSVSREGIEPPAPNGTCFTDRLDDQLSDRLMVRRRRLLRRRRRSGCSPSAPSSTGGTRTHNHEGLSFVAVPVRVPCQGCSAILRCRLLDQLCRLALGRWLSSVASARILESALTLHPRNHVCSTLERLLLAIGELHRELVFGFHGFPFQ